MKRDGHTHTEFCPHGNVHDTEELIQKAITLGFKEYSITEHAPIPKQVIEQRVGEPLVFTTAAMAETDLSYYFKKMNSLKEKYASDIKINIGFEVDYFEDFEAWTTDFLNEYGSQMDDGILSVHFLSINNELRGIDYTYEDYREGIVKNAGSFQKAQTIYYQTLLRSLEADLGKFKPKRLGHISLCQKFEKHFTEPTNYSADSQKAVTQLLTRVKQEKYALDLNASGFYKQGYQQSYPQEWITQQANNLSIPLVYGSDTHCIDDVGQGFEKVAHWL